MIVRAGVGRLDPDVRLVAESARSIRMAETLLAKLEQIEARDQPVGARELRGRSARGSR